MRVQVQTLCTHIKKSGTVHQLDSESWGRQRNMCQVQWESWGKLGVNVTVYAHKISKLKKGKKPGIAVYACNPTVGREKVGTLAIQLR